VLPLLAGCGSAGDDGLSVVAAFYPLQYVAQRVAGEQTDVLSLTSPGTEPHDAELSVSQTAEVVDADVLVYLSGFQPAVDDAVEQADGAETLDVADAVDLIPLSDDVSADSETEDGDQVDPHFWLDPTRLSAVAGEVADALAEVDPTHAEDYASNAADLEHDLMSLDREIRQALAGCARDTVVVSHNAFQYFGLAYGLHMRAIAGLSPESEPTPEHVAELHDLIGSEGITTVFSETLASPKMAETLSSDLGLGTAVLDPIEGLSDDTADEDYLSLMRANLAALQEANDCR
jgi:zinc transport system substrate-binding protein